VAETLIIETRPIILYNNPNAHVLVIGSTQFGAERDVVCDSIPAALTYRTTPTLELLDLQVLLIAFFVCVFCEHAIPSAAEEVRS
jgi:hypothetical protein